MKLAARLAALATAGALALGVVAPAYAAPGDPVTIPDTNLRECVTTTLELGKSETVTEQQMSSLTQLQCGYGDLRTLDGLQYATNLQVLLLDDVKIASLEPLSGLTKLTELYVAGAPLSDLSPLSSLSALSVLTVRDADVVDLSPLTSLPLRRLDLTNNKVTSLAPVATRGDLTELQVAGNEITDLSVLSGLSKLQYVTLASPSLSDLSPLAGLTDLSILSVSSPELESLAPLSNLSKLQSLTVTESPVADLTPLIGKSRLEFLTLVGTSVVSLDGIQGLPRLSYLTVTHGALKDVNHIPENSDIDLSHNQITDVSGVKDKTIIRLNLSHNSVTDVTPIGSIKKLYTADLSNNEITDATPLKNLVKGNEGLSLYGLGLANNHISDLSFVTYDLALSHAVNALGQTVTLPTTAQAGIPASPIKGRPGAQAIKYTVPTGATLKDGKIIYSQPGSYTVKWVQRSYYDKSEKGDYAYFGGTFTQTVVPATAIAPATPRISGTTRVGSRLTASAATWYPSGVALKYQWLRNGAAISRATASTYALTPSDLGKRISVRVTGSKTGLPTVAKTSASTAIIAKGILGAKTPSITGTAKKGKTLKVKMSAWTPAPVRITYQWLRNGSVISGANKSSYKLVKKDKKKRISVKVTGSKAGFTTVAKTSAKTAKVK